MLPKEETTNLNDAQIALKVLITATIMEPKQMDPIEVVVALLKDLRVGLGGTPTVPSMKYQVANVPAAVT